MTKELQMRKIRWKEFARFVSDYRDKKSDEFLTETYRVSPERLARMKLLAESSGAKEGSENFFLPSYTGSRKRAPKCFGVRRIK